MEAIAAGVVIVFVIGVATWFLYRHIEAIHGDVRTLKDQASLGMLASQDESRRIEELPYGERTPTEQRHLDSAAIKEAPQGSGEGDVQPG